MRECGREGGRDTLYDGEPMLMGENAAGSRSRWGVSNGDLGSEGARERERPNGPADRENAIGGGDDEDCSLVGQ